MNTELLRRDVMSKVKQLRTFQMSVVSPSSGTSSS